MNVRASHPKYPPLVREIMNRIETHYGRDIAGQTEDALADVVTGIIQLCAVHDPQVAACAGHDGPDRD